MLICSKMDTCRSFATLELTSTPSGLSLISMSTDPLLNKLPAQEICTPALGRIELIIMVRYSYSKPFVEGGLYHVFSQHHPGNRSGRLIGPQEMVRYPDLCV